MNITIDEVAVHLDALRACTNCPKMIGPVVTSGPVLSKVYLCGQAPGPHEGRLGKPFAWTAGKRMFTWFQSAGIDEEAFRNRVYMGAVCRCFPGKSKQGGDRVPAPDEIVACSAWMQREFAMLEPELVIAVGRLAIEQFLPAGPLAEIVGKQWRVSKWGHEFDLIPLPHPSGASTWFKREPGKSLLEDALQILAKHPAWCQVCQQPQLVK
jgi:uracil-DNA glycosylase